MLERFFLALIPLFVAVDAIGIMPIYINLTEDLDQEEKNIAIIQSVITASIVAFVFILVGKLVFRLLGITMGDFMIAGGVILFCIAITDLINPVMKRRKPGKDLGAVPLGTPLIVGPGVLTTTLVMIPQYGILPVLVSVLVNILFAGMVFRSSGYIVKVIGVSGSRAFSKIISLLLAAIAVMFIRQGFQTILNLKWE